jgi:hypothetical protein
VIHTIPFELALDAETNGVVPRVFCCILGAEYWPGVKFVPVKANCRIPAPTFAVGVIPRKIELL